MGFESAMARTATSSYQQGASPFDAALEAQALAYNQEADIYDLQAEQAAKEASAEAEIKMRDAQDFEAQQLLNYQGSGVMAVGGTPLEVANDTRRKADQEVQAILSRGKAQSELLRRKGGNIRNAGRADLLGTKSKWLAQEAQAGIQQASTRGSGMFGMLGSALAQLGGAVISRGITGGTKPSLKLPKAKPASGGPSWYQMTQDDY